MKLVAVCQKVSTSHSKYIVFYIRTLIFRSFCLVILHVIRNFLVFFLYFPNTFTSVLKSLNVDIYLNKLT